MKKMLAPQWSVAYFEEHEKVSDLNWTDSEAEYFDTIRTLRRARYASPFATLLTCSNSVRTEFLSIWKDRNPFQVSPLGMQMCCLEEARMWEHGTVWQVNLHCHSLLRQLTSEVCKFCLIQNQWLHSSCFAHRGVLLATPKRDNTLTGDNILNVYPKCLGCCLTSY